MAKLQDELAGGQMNTLSEVMNMLTEQGFKSKGAGAGWNGQKWLNLEQYEKGEFDKNEPERAYYRQKRITLILAILFSTLAVIFAFINIFQNSLALFKYILSYEK
jgi:hypothetical protein